MAKSKLSRTKQPTKKKSLNIAQLPEWYIESELLRENNAAQGFVSLANRELKKNTDIDSALGVVRGLVGSLNNLSPKAIHLVAIEQIFQLMAARKAYRELLHEHGNHLEDFDGEVERRVKAQRSALAKKAANAMLALDPKQKAKAEAKRLWLERKAGKHPKLRTNEQFATECLRRWPALTSSKVITSWCTQWNKEAKNKKSQSAC